MVLMEFTFLLPELFLVLSSGVVRGLFLERCLSVKPFIARKVAPAHPSLSTGARKWSPRASGYWLNDCGSGCSNRRLPGTRQGRSSAAATI
jgi:hypothetical protein